MADDKPKRKHDASNNYGFSIGGRRSAIVYNSPWWLLIMIIGWLYIIYQMQGNPDYGAAFYALREGIPLTLSLALFSFVIASTVGLIIGMIRAYPPQPPETPLPLNRQVTHYLQIALYHIITVYVEFMRGIPPVVLLLIVWLVVVPAIKFPFEYVISTIILPPLRSLDPELRDFAWRGQSFPTGLLGLSLFYSAFLSEVFRSGIQGVPRGQIEAANSLGMNYIQTMRFVVLPQAFRAILPELGNNFISMIKDTSLVTILAIKDITQLARTWSGSQFTYIETYAVLSLLYLTLTVPGSLLMQVLERYLRRFIRR
jgi:polar amino acid transport system permease protein